MARVIVVETCVYCQTHLVLDLLDPPYDRWTTYYLNDPKIGTICSECLKQAGYVLTNRIVMRSKTQLPIGKD